MSSRETKIIVVNSKKHGRHEILLDYRDYELVKDFTWSIGKMGNTFYALSTSYDMKDTRYTMLIHRVIMGVSNSKVFIDHINRNGLDNRRVNLRRCTSKQNLGNCRRQTNNTSGYKGVRYIHGTWEAGVGSRPREYLGRFKCKHAAARAYNEAAKLRFGEFARLNIIAGDDSSTD